MEGQEIEGRPGQHRAGLPLPEVVPDEAARAPDGDGLKDGGETEDDLAMLGTLEVLSVHRYHGVVGDDRGRRRWNRGAGNTTDTE